MDVELQGVSFRISGLRVAIGGGKIANGVELLKEATFAEARALIGQESPLIGTIVDVRPPRLNPLPVGCRFNLITSA
jgi:hypothetical protein